MIKILCESTTFITNCSYSDDKNHGTAIIFAETSNKSYEYSFIVDKLAPRDRSYIKEFQSYSGKQWNDSFNKFINNLLSKGIFRIDPDSKNKWKK